MKIILIIALSLALVASLEAKKCPFCSAGSSKTSKCKCSVSPQRAIKVACGPACTRLGYCCDPAKCPDCGVGKPSTSSGCSCFAPQTQRLIKYACGPACTAAGYCCTLWGAKNKDLRDKFCFVLSVVSALSPSRLFSTFPVLSISLARKLFKQT